MFLRFKAFVGPKVYEFMDPDTGYVYRENTFSDLLKSIISYREANKLETIPHIKTVVENYLCELPIHQDCCEPHPNIQRNFGKYIKGGVALLKSFLYKNMVTQEVADKRSEQCADCPFNVFPEKDTFVILADRVAEKSIGDRRSKYHDDTGNCEICSCLIRSKVWYKGAIPISDEEVVRMGKVNCWQLKHRVPSNK